MQRTSTPEIRLRPYREGQPGQPNELEFLYELYATTRADEMSQLVDWTDEQKEAFVRSQFQLQHDHYIKHYPGATIDVVLCDGKPIGRLYVYRAPSEIRLMEVTLLRLHCEGRGDPQRGARRRPHRTGSPDHHVRHGNSP